MADRQENRGVIDPAKELLEEHRRAQRQKEDEKRRKILQVVFRFLTAAAIVGLCGGLYLLSDVSKVRSITINGNEYISREAVLDLAGIDYNSRYVLLVPDYVQVRLLSHPLVEKALVTVNFDRSVRIDLTMKKAVAYYWSEDTFYLIMADGSALPLDPGIYQALTTVPLVKDITDSAELAVLVEGMKGLEPEVISGISEIWRFRETYDYFMFRFVMFDGNEIFTSAAGIPYLKSYYGIAEKLTSRSCVLIDEASRNAFTRSCAELNAEEQEAIKAITGETEPPSEEGGETPAGESGETPGEDGSAETPQQGEEAPPAEEGGEAPQPEPAP